MRATPGLLVSCPGGGAAAGALERAGCGGLYLLEPGGHDGRPTWRRPGPDPLLLHFNARHGRWQVSPALGSDACRMLLAVGPKSGVGGAAATAAVAEPAVEAESGAAAAAKQGGPGGGSGQGGFGQPGFGQAGFGVGGAPAAGVSVPAMQAEITSIVQRANPQSLAKIQGFFNK